MRSTTAARGAPGHRPAAATRAIGRDRDDRPVLQATAEVAEQRRARLPRDEVGEGVAGGPVQQRQDVAAGQAQGGGGRGHGARLGARAWAMQAVPTPSAAAPGREPLAWRVRPGPVLGSTPTFPESPV
jgi:hypothetical protein